MHDPLGREDTLRFLPGGSDAPTREGGSDTPDTVDGAYWLSLPKAEAMALVGLTDEVAYARVYKDIHDAVCTSQNREAQGGIAATIRLSKRKPLRQGHLIRLK